MLQRKQAEPPRTDGPDPKCPVVHKSKPPQHRRRRARVCAQLPTSPRRKRRADPHQTPALAQKTEAVLVVAEIQEEDRSRNSLHFVNAEQTYLVRRSDLAERRYRLHELTWLWRNAELPRDAEFKDANGTWKPVRKLVEPLLDKAREEEARKSSPTPVRHSRAWWWVAAAGAVLVVAITMWPEWRHRYSSWRSVKAEERQRLERERSARTDDVIRSNDIIPGMVPEQVRRTIGPPRAVNATGDGSVQRWIYRKQVVVFENGKVIGVEVPE